MQSIQERLLQALGQAITEKELEPVVAFDYPNRGHLYGMDGLATIVDVEFSFQSDYCTLHFSAPGLDLASVGIADASPIYRVSDNKISFHHLDYPEGTRLQGAVLIVSTLIDAFRADLGDG